MELRETFKLIYKMLMTLVTAALCIAAVAAWWYSTPANQLMLIAGILAILALISGLSISKLDDQDRRAEAFRDIVDDIRDKSPVTMRFSDAGKVEWGLKDGSPNVQFAEPDVHRVDAAGVEEAKRLAAAGAPIDEICRAVDPGFDRQDSLHQQAFRKLVQAMVDEA